MSAASSEDPADNQSGGLLTYEQTAVMMGCSTRTVRRLVSAGQLVAVKLGPASNASVRIHRVAVLDYLARYEAQKRAKLTDYLDQFGLELS